jgi:RNA polymerase sigma-70 factor (ECF subfamily)
MTPDRPQSGEVPAADPDAPLVLAMARGDKEALAELYDRYAFQLMGLAIRIVRDRREAEDLLHDVFLEVWKSAKDFDPKRGRVRTWLTIRMRSRALDLQKSARVSRNAGDDALDRMVESTDTSGAPDRDRVRRLLGDLPPDQRAVLELAYFEGLSCSEIATKLDVPIGTVKSRVAAALAKLRLALCDLDKPAAAPPPQAKPSRGGST